MAYKAHDAPSSATSEAVGSTANGLGWGCTVAGLAEGVVGVVVAVISVKKF